MASFDSVSFTEKLADGGMWSVESDIELANTDHHIPGTNDNVNIDLGLLTRVVEIPFTETGTVKDSLVAKIGTSASLVWHEGTVTAKLVGVMGLKKHSTLDKYRGRLKVKIG